MDTGEGRVSRRENWGFDFDRRVYGKIVSNHADDVKKIMAHGRWVYGAYQRTG